MGVVQCGVFLLWQLSHLPNQGDGERGYCGTVLAKIVACRDSSINSWIMFRLMAQLFVVHHIVTMANYCSLGVLHGGPIHSFILVSGLRDPIAAVRSVLVNVK